LLSKTFFFPFLTVKVRHTKRLCMYKLLCTIILVLGVIWSSLTKYCRRQSMECRGQPLHYSWTIRLQEWAQDDELICQSVWLLNVKYLKCKYWIFHTLNKVLNPWKQLMFCGHVVEHVCISTWKLQVWIYTCGNASMEIRTYLLGHACSALWKAQFSLV